MKYMDSSSRMVVNVCSLLVAFCCFLLVVWQSTADNGFGNDESCAASTEFKLMSTKTSYALVTKEETGKEPEMSSEKNVY